jgi:hypothetical protein
MENVRPKDSKRPLAEFIDTIAAISSRDEETRCGGVLDKVIGFPEVSGQLLERLHDEFLEELEKFGWADVGRWIDSWTLSYRAGLEGLATAARNAHKRFGSHYRIMTTWNSKLRVSLKAIPWDDFNTRKILCAFSSAVDASRAIGPPPSLTGFVADAAGIAAEQLLNEAYGLYTADLNADRKSVKHKTELFAELMFGYRNPGQSLKPELTVGEDAERWLREYYIKRQQNESTRLPHTAGGASLNMADALAGMGFPAHGFWPYHPEQLAGARLACCGSPDAVRRCWFDGNWQWRDTACSAAGGGDDDTGHAHPVRLSLVTPFAPHSEPFVVPHHGATVKPASHGRVIFQFKDHRAADYFQDANAAPGRWPGRALFSRWQWNGIDTGEGDSAVFEDADQNAMQHVREAAYHRVILSGIQWLEDQPLIDKLGQQCRGLPIHHEISGRFDTRKAVEDYLRVLRGVYPHASEKTAGMNDGELKSFTSWYGTETFVAPLPARGDTLLQRLFRAMRVREVLDLDWLYVHGNEIDLTVVRPDHDEQFAKELQTAMLLAKVCVVSALHVRSDILTVPARFEPSFPPKALLAMYQFARDMADAFGRTPGETQTLYERALLGGCVCGHPGLPGVVAIPVYWPDPEDGCSMTAAGDIASGVTAAIAPSVAQQALTAA